MAIDLNNVTVELLLAHADGQECPEQSLAKLDFICSTLKFDSYSDQSKDIDLVSNEIVISDTRFRGEHHNILTYKLACKQISLLNLEGK